MVNSIVQTRTLQSTLGRVPQGRIAQRATITPVLAQEFTALTQQEIEGILSPLANPNQIESFSQFATSNSLPLRTRPEVSQAWFQFNEVQNTITVSARAA